MYTYFIAVIIGGGPGGDVHDSDGVIKGSVRTTEENLDVAA